MIKSSINHILSESLINNIPDEFDVDLCFSKAAVEFIIEAKNIFNMKIPEYIIAKNISKKQFILLVRDENKNINFYHSTPGQGTRIATIQLDQFSESDNLFILLEWNPDEIFLHIGNGKKDALISSTGTVSKIQFRVDKEKNIHTIQENSQIKSFIKEGEVLLLPTAIESWLETIQSINILMKAKSPDGYMFDSILTNTILVSLVTGFESYCKRRFLELPEEGIAFNNENIHTFFKSKELEIKLPELYMEESREKDISILKLLILKNRINFQNYDECKKSFYNGYGLKFTNISLDNKVLLRIKKLISYRHRIIHYSSSVRIWNLNKHQNEPLDFPSNENRTEAIKYFSLFINALHQETLQLGK